MSRLPIIQLLFIITNSSNCIHYFYTDSTLLENHFDYTLYFVLTYKFVCNVFPVFSINGNNGRKARSLHWHSEHNGIIASDEKLQIERPERLLFRRFSVQTRRTNFILLLAEHRIR